jgi:hypothetical protein
VPYTPTTPTLLLCDALVAVLAADWDGSGNPPAAPSGPERAYFKRIGDADSGEDERLVGRRVIIYPTGYSNDPASRGEDDYAHRVSVQVFERYTDAGDPPREWIDERVDFVWARIAEGFDFSHSGPPAWNRKLLTVSADVVVLDLGKLLGAGSMFVSQVDFVFSEIRDA